MKKISTILIYVITSISTVSFALNIEPVSQRPDMERVVVETANGRIAEKGNPATEKILTAIQEEIDNRQNDRFLTGAEKVHVELETPKQDTESPEEEIRVFTQRLNLLVSEGYMISIPDNAMGKPHYTAVDVLEMIKEEGLLKASAQQLGEQVIVHINTFHAKSDLDDILERAKAIGIKKLLVVSGDGSERLTKLDMELCKEGKDAERADFARYAGEFQSITSVELIRYIKGKHPGAFTTGVAFNPYEPEEHEMEKLDRKIAAGADFIITQPVMPVSGKTKDIKSPASIVDKLRNKGKPVVLGAYMSANRKMIELLAKCLGIDYDLNPDGTYAPMENMAQMHYNYPEFGTYLTMLWLKSVPDEARMGKIRLFMDALRPAGCAPETRQSLWDAVNLFHKTKMEIFIQSATELTDEVKRTVNMLRLKQKENGADFAVTRYNPDQIGNLDSVAQVRGDDVKRIVITSGTAAQKIADFIKDDNNAGKFRNVRLFNIIPLMLRDERMKTLCQIELITEAIVARLLDEKNEKLKTLFKTMIEGSFESSEVRADDFVNRMAKAEDGNTNIEDIRQRVLYFIDGKNTIGLVRKLAQELEAMKILMTFA